MGARKLQQRKPRDEAPTNIVNVDDVGLRLVSYRDIYKGKKKPSIKQTADDDGSERYKPIENCFKTNFILRRVHYEMYIFRFQEGEVY